ncbi:MAG: undecaprenyl/decaprenyl-phosphate alpha-N-acetylglucosaminyl 1-phosphate transferase [Thermoleophilia bacterium]|nr:undecaprenyl/decaprenyl-phosphate alpha-N-acetylglucosaminyl 1-phosphate transferase [Thermoleophilia bacterium]
MSFPDALRTLLAWEVAVGFAAAVAIVLALTPLVARLAPRIGGVDDRRDRPRVHERPVPRIGGVAIVVAIVLPAALLLGEEPRYLAILGSVLAVSALGLVDDIRGLRPRTKMLAVVLVALVPVVAFDVRFERVTLPLIGDHELGWLSVPVSLLWIAALANLVNLIDGMDSLAAGIVAIAAGSFALLAASFGRLDSAVLAAIVCGAALAFLRHNYHPASVFMGDSGALALGFVLAALAIDGVLKTAATIALVAPLLVIAVPILDTSFVVAKRLKYRRPPWSADHNHFYHRFMRIGYSQRRTAAYLHAWAALLAAYAIVLRFVPPRPGGDWDAGNAAVAGVGAVLVAATSVWMVYTLEILKARHLQALGLGRLVDEEREESVERVLTAGRR